MDTDREGEAYGSHERLLPEGGPSVVLRKKHPQKPFLTVILSITVLMLGFSNIYLLIRSSELNREIHSAPSKFSGHTYDTLLTYYFFTDYSSENNSISDPLWDNLNMDSSMIALDDQWASQHGLVPSESRFPWDKSKGLYIVKVFHQLHCLKIFRKAFVDLERGNKPTIASRHVHHCLDALRQDVSCYADDTPMSSTKSEDALGDKQVRMCRNLDKLVGWIQAPEQNACHHRLSDYKWVYNKMERYAFCPDDSAYKSVAASYFEKHGHHDPFAPP